MAAVATCSSRLEITGLGKDTHMQDVAVDGTTPTAMSYQYRVLAVADTAEALDLTDVATVSMLMIRAIDYDLDVDLDYVSAFDKDLTVKAGEPAAVIPNPAGVVYVKNNGAAEAPKYEFIIVGTT